MSVKTMSIHRPVYMPYRADKICVDMKELARVEKELAHDTVAQFFESFCVNDLPNVVQHWNSYKIQDDDVMLHMKKVFRTVLLVTMDLLVENNFIGLFKGMDYLHIPIGILHVFTQEKLATMKKHYSLFFTDKISKGISIDQFSGFKFIDVMEHGMLRDRITKELCMDIMECCSDDQDGIEATDRSRNGLMEAISIISLITQTITSEILDDSYTVQISNNVKPIINVGSDSKKLTTMTTLSKILHEPAVILKLGTSGSVRQFLDQGPSFSTTADNVKVPQRSPQLRIDQGQNKAITQSPPSPGDQRKKSKIVNDVNVTIEEIN
jgi:hypothetical protein